ncbi:TRAP transporter small permease [Martelella sp. HB161492]|uniref:TRAP transporter small permease n=1 Tax=Martelella sp. HB161492 TaxID=2720726 RepID=UPI00158FBF4B|nr:TRAP transporter small permease [Martelella sp. HB161492]
MSDTESYSLHDRAAHPLVRGIRIVLSLVAGILLMVLMMLTVSDVIGRYIFNAPITGASELSELLLVSIVFLGLPAVCLDGGHVTVDLVTKALPARIEEPRVFLTGIISAIVLGVVCWRLFAYGDQVASYLVTNSLRIRVAPFIWFCAVMTGVSSAITLVIALAALRRRKP